MKLFYLQKFIIRISKNKRLFASIGFYEASIESYFCGQVKKPVMGITCGLTQKERNSSLIFYLCHSNLQLQGSLQPKQDFSINNQNQVLISLFSIALEYSILRYTLLLISIHICKLFLQKKKLSKIQNLKVIVIVLVLAQKLLPF